MCRCIFLQSSLQHLPDCRVCSFRVRPTPSHWFEYSCLCAVCDNEGGDIWARILFCLADVNLVEDAEVRGSGRGGLYLGRTLLDFGWPTYWKTHNVWSQAKTLQYVRVPGFYNPDPRLNRTLQMSVAHWAISICQQRHRGLRCFKKPTAIHDRRNQIAINA